MNEALYNLVNEYRSISIVGMCKNAGKTTVLGRLLQDFACCSDTLALTSIGLDGEAMDLVTGTEKPAIYVKEGSLIATAEGLLRHCDVTREILAATGITTPLGEVMVVRAKSDGHVILAGPSMVRQLVEISRLFRELGANRVIIDGAAGRKSLCSRSLAEATVLSSGASCGRGMDAVVAETAHVCRLLMTPEINDAAIKDTLKTTAQMGGKYLLLGKENTILPDGADLIAVLRQTHLPRLLYVEGAVTDSFLDPLLRSALSEGLAVAVRDASRLLLSADSLRRLTMRNGRLEVLEAIHLAALTINPHSVYGYDFDEPEFLRRMKAAVPVPVVNVQSDGGNTR